MIADKKAYHREWYQENREKAIAKTKDWKRNNPEKAKQYQLEWRLKNKYHISLEEYTNLLIKQNYTCAICPRKFQDSDRWSPHVDHDHQTDKVRGLLCHNCNTKVGWYEKFKEIIINYLSER